MASSSFLANLSRQVNEKNQLVRTNPNGSLITTTTLQNGSIQFLQGKMKDGTTVAGAYMSGVARNDNTTLYLNFLLDNSGSMAVSCGVGKTRLQVVLACMEKLCKSPFIRPQDYLVVHTCNGDVRWRCSCPALDYDHARLQKDVAATGGTRLWDGILTSYYNMKEHNEKYKGGKKVLRYMLAFTDGGDNASKTDVTKLADTLAHPGLANFHVVVIAAGLDTYDSAKLEILLQAKHCKLISVQSASELDISRAFDEALSHMRTLIVQLSNGQQQVVTHSGSREGAAKFEAMIGKQVMANFSKLSVLDAGATGFNLRALTAGSSGGGNNGGNGGGNGRSQSAQRGRPSNGGGQRRGRSSSRNPYSRNNGNGKSRSPRRSRK